MVPRLQVVSKCSAFYILLDSWKFSDYFAFGKRFKETVGRGCDDVPLLRNEVVPQPRVGDADLSGGEEELAADEAGAG